MGYIILARRHRDGSLNYVAWVPTEDRGAYTLFAEMSRWLETGQTMEILKHGHGDPYKEDMWRQCHEWRDHLRRMDNGET